MNLNWPLTEQAERVLQVAKVAAKNESCPLIDTEHLLIGLVAVKESFAARRLLRLGIDRQRINHGLSAMPEWYQRGNSAGEYSAAFLLSLANASNIAEELQYPAINPLHLLGGLIQVAERTERNRELTLFDLMGIDPIAIRLAVQEQMALCIGVQDAARYLDARAIWYCYCKIDTEWRRRNLTEEYGYILPAFDTATELQQYISTLPRARLAHWIVLLKEGGVEAYLSWIRHLHSPASTAPPELKDARL